jgi:hypothetical protein
MPRHESRIAARRGGNELQRSMRRIHDVALTFVVPSRSHCAFETVALAAQLSLQFLELFTRKDPLATALSGYRSSHCLSPPRDR